MLDAEKKRKGRRSTILTGTGLNEIEEENIEKKTLLGGQMFSTITKFFQKKKKSIEKELEMPEVLILEDITYENEVKKSKTKDTKETKSTLTFGK